MKLHGAIAAAVTPLREAGGSLDLDAVGPLISYWAAGGIDGVLVAGTTGEGVLVGPGDSGGASEGAVEVVGSGVGAVDGSTTATDGRASGIEGPVVPPAVEEVANP